MKANMENRNDPLEKKMEMNDAEKESVKIPDNNEEEYLKRKIADERNYQKIENFYRIFTGFMSFCFSWMTGWSVLNVVDTLLQKDAVRNKVISSALELTPGIIQTTNDLITKLSDNNSIGMFYNLLFASGTFVVGTFALKEFLYPTGSRQFSENTDYFLHMYFCKLSNKENAERNTKEYNRTYWLVNADKYDALPKDY